ncbi:glycosyl hydrolase [Robinsoniella sp. KNHs210]|uniref:glycosyl hydrolase n=1 Tax=Robinsoniella sp. KNHs210 TaxID=1469950 RepID=UPI000485BDCF|nr:glycosyl hydrolase [Robinsoniella sp. KNHs210]
MLYQKNEQPFSAALFENPTSEYRGTPFWAWNCRLEKKELLWQIEQLEKMGFGGAHIHVRTGMETTYLSDEFIDLVKSCAERMQSRGMLTWLYDEDRWPSGAAGGYVTRNESYRSRHLLLTRHPYGEMENVNEAVSSAASGRTGNGSLIACYDIALNAEGMLLQYRRMGAEEQAEGIKLYAYEEIAAESPWFNHQTYIDTLNPKAVAEFIRITYERYYDAVGAEFGSTIPAIFTDEPQFPHKVTLEFNHTDKDVILPWTGDFPDSYKTAYPGEEILDCLPELLWELPGEQVSVIRYHYHDHIAERFASAFADQCGKWCREHGLMLTGHMMEEPTLKSQTAALGEAMRSYRSFQLPGVDILDDSREFTTVKQAQSAARQFGCPGVASELYGVTNWDFDFRGHKLQGDWQAALGVTVRVPHLSWVSMKGEAKRDYPATFNYQAPWYDQYSYVENHFARVNTAMTRGKAVCHIGVIHPIESYWLHWGSNESTQLIRSQMDENFQNLTKWLLEGLLDFDYICESLLPEQCKVEDIKKKRFPVGKMEYKVLVVPPVETLRSTTLARLEAFQKMGGRILFFGEAPALCDGYPSGRGRQIWEKSERVMFYSGMVQESLKEVRNVEIRDSHGEMMRHFICQLREDGNDLWLFIAHSDKPVNQDISQIKDAEYLIRVKGNYQVTIMDTMNGKAEQICSVCENGWTLIKQQLFEHDSLLLRLAKSKEQNRVIAEETEEEEFIRDFRYLKPVPVTFEEPNVLMLDIAEAALDDEPYRQPEEILRLDNKFRKELGWDLRGEAVAQPWVEEDASTPHTLRLRYTIQSQKDMEGLMLALENDENATVLLNGQPAEKEMGWYVDKCMYTVKLPGILKGENILELFMPYGKKADAEACFLLGNFGVQVMGCCCVLTEPVTELTFGDITRQGLPFYGGNLTYHLEAETTGNKLEIEASYYRGHLIKIYVDGEEQGNIAFSPYRICINNLKPGRHKIDLKYYGSRVNTFGQLHRNDRSNSWSGPNSWRTDGAAWTWEYRFWKQGILKSPEIKDLILKRSQ